MHDILTLLYCCGADIASPTPQWWFDAVTTMCDAVIPGHPSLDYFDDPIVIISFFHSKFEPATFDMDTVIGRFMHEEDAGADTSTKVWGPAAWNILHELARGDQYMHVRTLLECWTSILPCAVCRRHLKAHIACTDIKTTTRAEAHDYTVMLHNAVNLQLDKPLYDPS